MYFEITHDNSNLSIDSINSIFQNDKIKYNLVRVDDTIDKKLVVYSMQINDMNIIPSVIEEVKKLDKTIEINVINNSTL